MAKFGGFIIYIVYKNDFLGKKTANIVVLPLEINKKYGIMYLLAQKTA